MENENLNLDQFRFKQKIQVRYADLDTMGHVNNATYLSYLEQGRIAYFENVVNFDKSKLDFGFVVARIEIDYLTSIELDDEIELYVKCSRIGNKSADFETIIVKNNQTMCCSSKVVIVAVDQSGKSVSISEAWKRDIMQFEK